jgi:hypothetical protein
MVEPLRYLDTVLGECCGRIPVFVEPSEDALGKIPFRERGRAGDKIPSEVDRPEREDGDPDAGECRDDRDECAHDGGDHEIDGSTGHTPIFARVFGLSEAINE